MTESAYMIRELSSPLVLNSEVMGIKTICMLRAQRVQAQS